MRPLPEIIEDPNYLDENELAEIAVEIGFRIHRKWGPGLLECVYEELMIFHLRKIGLFVEQQKDVPFAEDGVKLPVAFRADIIVEKKLMIELKSIERFAPVHAKKLGTYLRLTNLKLGLLMNFGEYMLKDGLKRIINGYL